MLPIALTVLLFNYAPPHLFYNGSCHKVATSCPLEANCQAFTAVHCESVRCYASSTQATCQILACDGYTIDEYSESCGGYSSWSYCIGWVGNYCSIAGVLVILL